MESKSKLTKTLQIRLPDDMDEREISQDDFLDQLVLTGDDVDGDREQDQQMETIEETIDELEDYEKLKKVQIDEIPKEDFFEAKEVKVDRYGEIEGMDEVASDEEDEDESSPTYGFSKRTNRLSISAKKFSVDVGKTSPDAQSQKSETGSIRDEDKIKEKEKDRDRESRRVSRVTIIEMAAAKTREEESKPRLTTSESIVTADFKASMGPSEGEDVSRIIDTKMAPRTSTVEEVTQESRDSARSSIYYDQPTRIEDTDEDIMEFFDLSKHDTVVVLDDLEQEAEEEEAASVAEEGPAALVREPYYEKYDTLSEEINQNRTKNYILQKKVCMYLKRRKVDNYIKDIEPPLDQTNKYNQKLDAYQEVLEISRTQRTAVDEELDILKKKRTEQNIQLEKLFKAMQTREGNIGYGLIHTKTGNPIPDKLVERLIRRQHTQMEQVSTMRLKYIKLKGMVQEKLDAIDKLDVLENNLRLADYEQLKVDNRNYADKLEERDEELTRLRAKCQNTIQILAHLREKSSAFDSDLCDLKEELEEAEDKADQNRANLSDLKHERDKYRHLISQVKDESGLLTQPDLLRDMEASQKELDKIQAELKYCQDDVKSKTTQVRNIRKNIEILSDPYKNRLTRLKASLLARDLASYKSEITLSLSIGKNRPKEKKAMIYKGRPTLYMPTIDQGAFIDIARIKPNRVYGKKRK